MKNILILSLLFLFTANLNNLYAETLLMFAEANGQDVIVSPDTGEMYCGYLDIKVTDTSDGTDRTVTVECKDPGFEPCDESQIPIIIVCRNSDLKKYAENEIRVGHLSGSYNNNIFENGHFYYRTVFWNSTGINNITQITISLQEALL